MRTHRTEFVGITCLERKDAICVQSIGYVGWSVSSGCSHLSANCWSAAPSRDMLYLSMADRKSVMLR